MQVGNTGDRTDDLQDGGRPLYPSSTAANSPCVTISVFVVNPLGTSCGWGSSRPVALLTTPPEARCAARLDVFLGGEVLVRGAGAFLIVCRGAVSVGAAEGGDRLEGTGYDDHLSYSARWGNPPFARGGASGGV
ncbi:unnamed protein product [Pleuronectes platessa]|uniref:Uncharacterized protein n=1 Tax=Pleuronectes platessa TaxID=8262 RepID=A0A9N7V847_PLEPL|nr:unnamed protein product [Pleuronectes platessa]